MNATGIAALIATAGAIVSSPALAQSGSDFDRYYGPHMMWSGYGMVFGPLFMILVLGLTIVVAVLIVRWLGGTNAPTAHGPAGRTPLDILKERFARGEIDKDEFEERRRALGE